MITYKWERCIMQLKANGEVFEALMNCIYIDGKKSFLFSEYKRI